MINLKLDLPGDFLKEETRDGFLVTSQRKQLWGVLLDLLVQVDNVCKKHSISYFLCGGTLLGAVRHGGFIPWDDDLDIMMDRNNYNRFVSIAASELKQPYFLQTEKTDPGCLYRFCKIRNSFTTGIVNAPYYVKNNRINQGIFIDIFCLDKIPDDNNERKVWFGELYSLWGKVWKLGAFENNSLQCGFFEYVCTGIKYYLLRLLGKRSCYFDRFERLASKYKDNDTKNCCHIAGTLRKDNFVDPRYIWRCEDYIQFENRQFEFLSLPIPVEYDMQLTSLYGDWHKFVVGQSTHGSIIVDTDTPFYRHSRKIEESIL